MRTLVSTAVLLTLLPAIAGATVLCERRRGALIVREECRFGEQQVTADRAREIGLEGKPGPRGPAGPPTGDLKVLDAGGGEVGIVIGTRDYVGSARVLKQLALPNVPGESPYYVLEVTKKGLWDGSSCDDASLYRTSNCTGDAFFSCAYGECGSVAGAFFARPLLRADDTTACYPGSSSEFERGDFYFRSRAISNTPSGAVAVCQSRGGTVVGPAADCFRPGLFCVPCCRLRSNQTVVPLHQVDASIIGTPPFRLGH